jgi:hypothetical protein
MLAGVRNDRFLSNEAMRGAVTSHVHRGQFIQAVLH